MIPVFATIPVADLVPYIVVGCIVIGILGFIGFGIALKFAREVRHGLAEELKREIASEKESKKIEMQQPFEVKEHVTHVTSTEHAALRSEFTDLREQRRKDVSGLHLKIEQGLVGVRQDIAGEFRDLRETQVTAREEIAVLKNETASQTRQLHALDTKIENLPEKIGRLIDRQK